MTVVGDAGVGKSRLVAEALAAVEARVVRGRCLPYGEGITYWPVVEVVKQLAALPSDPVAAAAIRSLLGESDVGTSGDEIAWAFRKLLEEQAPLVVVFDDIQWGEETFLDLVESTALLSAGAPLLLLCMARPELRGAASGLAGDAAAGAARRAEEADALIGDARLRGAARADRARGGRQPAVHLGDARDGGRARGSRGAADAEGAARGAARPARRAPSAGCSSAARSRARSSTAARVQALAPEETQVTTRLAALVRRQLVRPDRAQLAGDDGYRFRHLLIRDAAYDALPKAVRADLHARFADWLDEHGHALVERDEIVGYHLEQASPLPGGARAARPRPRRPRRRPARRRRQPRESTARTTGPQPRCSLAQPSSYARTGLDLTLELEAAWAAGSVDAARGSRDGGSGHRTRRGRG